MIEDSNLSALKSRLEQLDQERERVISEIERYKQDKPQPEQPPLLGTTVATKTPITPEEKIDLFLNLFCCRQSVKVLTCPNLILCFWLCRCRLRGALCSMLEGCIGNMQTNMRSEFMTTSTRRV